MSEILASSVFYFCVGVGVTSFFYAIQWAVKGGSKEVAVFSGLVVISVITIISLIQMGWIGG